MTIKSEWKRDMQHNYLIITDNCTETDSYEEEMLKYNQIPGIVSYYTQKVDEEQKFYYDTGSLIPLTEYMKKSKFDYTQLKSAAYQLILTIKNCSEYLLKPENLILDPDFVLISIKDANIWFCYYPDYHVEVKKQLALFFEFIMNCINYADKDSVYLIYSMYMKSKEDTCTVSELEKILSENSQETKEPEPEIKEEPVRVTEGNVNEQSGQSTYIYKENAAIRQTVSVPLQLKPEEEHNHGVLNKLKFHLNKVFHPEDKQEEQFQTKEVLTSTVSENKNFVPETVPFFNQNTVYRFETKLSSQREEEYESITIKSFPYYVGSAKEKNNFVIDHPKVSPYQFKITQEGNHYFICDLYSKTGTFVNGNKLVAEKMNEITTGDRVAFGDRTYIFSTPTNNYFN